MTVRRSVHPKGRTKAPPVRDKVLLLRRTPYGESSLVIHGISEANGRVELIAKGAHRPKSRFSGVLDWFDTLELEWTLARADEGTTGRRRAGTSNGDAESSLARGLSPLRWGDLSERRRWLSRSLSAYRAAHTALELTDLSTRSGFADSPLYHLLEAALVALDELARQEARGLVLDGEVRIKRRLARFELQLLDQLGLAPSLLRCAACGEAAPSVSGEGLERRAPFSALGGGRLCGLHAAEAVAAGLKVGTLPLVVLEGAAALMNDTRTTPVLEAPDHRVALPGTEPEPKRGAQAPVDPELALIERILDFAGRFLDHQLEARPKSHAAFLAKPDRNRRNVPIRRR